jgi:hypothetical protein
MATPLPGWYALPTVKAIRELPFRVTQYLPPGCTLSAQESRDESLRSQYRPYQWSGHACTHLGETKLLELLLKVIYGVEDGWVLLKEVAKGLGESLRPDLSNLAQPTDLILSKMPVDLTEFARSQLGDAGRAGSVVSRVATLHVSEHKVL